jgi:SAM-dependent methyltransferase
MALKINLGCGRKYLDDYVNCDVLPAVKADKYFDLNAFPYPFDAGCADEVFLDNVLEHLDDIPKVMEELHRILRPGGRLRILVPYGKTDWAMQDPTHKHFFTENSLNYFIEGHAYNFYSNVRFKLHQARLYGDSTNIMHKLRNMLPLKKYLRYFLFNIYDGIYFELEKVEAPAGPSATPATPGCRPQP